jgi:hypothetical protein
MCKSTKPRSRRRKANTNQNKKKTQIKTQGLRCCGSNIEPECSDLFLSSKKPKRKLTCLWGKRRTVICISERANVEERTLSSGNTAYFAEGALLIEKAWEGNARVLRLVSLAELKDMLHAPGFWKNYRICKRAKIKHWGGERRVQVSC